MKTTYVGSLTVSAVALEGFVSPAEAFGRALCKRRKATPLTQKKVALAADLERVFISLLETGKQQPSFETMLKLATALKCKAADIVKDAEALIDAN